MHDCLADHITAYSVDGHLLLVSSHSEAIEALKELYPDAEWEQVDAAQALRMFPSADWVRADGMYTLCAPWEVYIESEGDMIDQLNALSDAIGEWEQRRDEGKKNQNPAHVKRMMNPRNY